MGIYHGANWCKNGVTRYSNFWYDTAHPKAEDMICDWAKMHYIRPSLGNGHFHSHTWKSLNNWCHMYYTQYADVNGNGVDDAISHGRETTGSLPIDHHSFESDF